MFMQLVVTQKGALYCADCAKCGMTHYSHEWATFDNNDMRDNLQNGSYRCDCGGTTDADTFHDCGRQYAARYSANGFMDCTDWHFGKNKQKLVREVRDLYGD